MGRCYLSSVQLALGAGSDSSLLLKVPTGLDLQSVQEHQLTEFERVRRAAEPGTSLAVGRCKSILIHHQETTMNKSKVLTPALQDPIPHLENRRWAGGTIDLPWNVTGTKMEEEPIIFKSNYFHL
jgi:hypothetical protein